MAERRRKPQPTKAKTPRRAKAKAEQPAAPVSRLSRVRATGRGGRGR